MSTEQEDDETQEPEDEASLDAYIGEPLDPEYLAKLSGEKG